MTKMTVDQAVTSSLTESPSRLPLEEESQLLAAATKLKSTANTLFTSAEYTEAIDGYNRAYDTLPTYLDYDLAVLKSNIAACHIKLAEWKSAIESATTALEKLDLVDPLPETPKQGDGKKTESAGIIEIDDATSERQTILQEVSKKTLTDTSNLRTKTLLRRAKARAEEGGWSNLQGAHEDYTLLSSFSLTSIDRKTVDKALREIPPRLDKAKQEEMADMIKTLDKDGDGKVEVGEVTAALSA